MEMLIILRKCKKKSFLAQNSWKGLVRLKMLKLLKNLQDMVLRCWWGVKVCGGVSVGVGCVWCVCVCFCFCFVLFCFVLFCFVLFCFVLLQSPLFFKFHLTFLKVKMLTKNYQDKKQSHPINVSFNG